MKLQQSFAAMVLMAAVACHAEEAGAPVSGGCDRPTDPPAAESVVATPDYAAGAEDAVGEENVQRLTAWAEYQRSVQDALVRSPDPRDWVTAALIPTYEFVSATPQRRDTSDLLGRALVSLGDDPFTLMLVATEGSTELRESVLQRLGAAAPENAATWVLVLNGATKRNDRAGVDAALHRIADASRFDTYSAKLLDVASDAYRRFPPPAALLASQHEGAPVSAELVATTSALALSGAHGMPAFQYLTNACRVDGIRGINLGRRDDCAAAGRLLMLHSDTLLASHIGMSLLRVSKTYGDDDLRAARDVDWIFKQYMSFVPNDESDAAFAQFVRFHDDWIATGSEVTAMRRSVERAGLPLTPPGDWDDTQSVFSERRLHQDAAATRDDPTRH